MKNLKLIKRVMILWLYIAFIFSNSLTPAALSSNNSDFIASIANDFLSFFNISVAFRLLTFVIRKAAHFIEYFFLGLLLQVTLNQLSQKTKVYLISLLSVLIPLCDELLQKITPGRSCQIKDMLLDLFGILCGIFLYHLISYLKKQKKKS